jgi:hypothetical protein
LIGENGFFEGLFDFFLEKNSLLTLLIKGNFPLKKTFDKKKRAMKDSMK